MSMETILSVVRLDVYDHDTSPTTIKTIALDSQTRYVHAYLQRNGITYQPDPNAVVTLTAIRPDKVGAESIGQVIMLDEATDDGPAIYGLEAEITQAMIAVPGVVLFQFKMEVDEEALRTEIFRSNNGRAFDGEVSSWADEYQGYNLDEFAERIASVESIAGDIDNLSEELHDLEQTTNELFNLTSTIYVRRWINGGINAGDGRNNNYPNRCRSRGYILGSDLSANGKVKLTIASGFKVGAREYTGDVTATNEYVGVVTFDNGEQWAQSGDSFTVLANHAYRFVISKTNDANMNISDIGSMTVGYFSLQTTDLTLTKSGASADAKAVGDALAPTTTSNRDTSTILAAKYFTYADGTTPVIDWYLLCDTNDKLYISNSLKGKKYICYFQGATNYKFGIRQNGDIIAVYRNEFSETGATHDSLLDAVRQNPFVLLKSEDYTVKHEVDFEGNLKPTGWLENCGFCSLPNGDIIFGEYTRMMVLYTSNLWRIKATDDITDPESWEMIKSFTVAENDTDNSYDESVIEHFHTVQVDPYTGIIYFATGDTKKKSQIWWSDDGGDTWNQQEFVDPVDSQAKTSGEKMFRLLNFNFTEDYVYWSSDSSTEHAILRCERDADGGFDPESMTILATLPQLTGNPATYGTVLYEDLGLMVLMERCDATAASMLFRAFDLTDNTVKTIRTINTTGGTNKYLGFRTEYTEFEPSDGVIKVGYGSNSKYRNVNAICGNSGNMDWHYNINNLWIRICKDYAGNARAKFGTYYI